MLAHAPGLTDIVTMNIDTGDHTPVHSRPYQNKKEVNTLLEEQAPSVTLPALV